MPRIKKDLIASENLTNVPTFTREEVEGLLNADNYMRAVALTELLKKTLPASPKAAPTDVDSLQRMKQKFDMTYELAMGDARMLMWANDDFPAYMAAKIKLEQSTQHLNFNAKGNIVIAPSVPMSPLDEKTVPVIEGEAAGYIDQDEFLTIDPEDSDIE